MPLLLWYSITRNRSTMEKLKKCLLILLALSSTYLIKAQDVDPVVYSKLPLSIAFGNHAIGFPFENSFKAFNPHFSVGTELGLNKNQKHRLLLSSNLGFFKNKVIGNSWMADIELGYRYTHKTGLFIETGLGLGLIVQFHPRDIYALNPSNGSYDQVSDKGTFASLIGLKTGLGYDFSKHSKHPFRIGINHHFFIQSPYFDLESFPIMPQSTTNISLSYKFKKQ